MAKKPTKDEAPKKTAKKKAPGGINQNPRPISENAGASLRLLGRARRGSR